MDLPVFTTITYLPSNQSTKTVVPDRLGRRRLKRLLRAAEEKAFKGTIPWDCAEAIAAHEQIDREYTRAWQMMLEHLDAQALEIIDLRERLRSTENRKPR